MIYALIGIPGAGKSTIAQLMVRYTKTVIIGRDHLREKMFGYRPDNTQAFYDNPDRDKMEKIITAMQDVMIAEALRIDQDVIIDNTNLDLKTINHFKKFNVPMKFVLVDVDLTEAIERDSHRISPVGADVITAAHQKLEHLKKVFDFKDWTPPEVGSILPSDALGGAFVFDIDGTLSINNSGRSPYDWKRVGEDDVNMPVKMTLDALREQGWPIVICTGRDAVCRTETMEWLEKHDIEYDSLYMRLEKDNRKDAVVKEEMWREISKHVNILAIFDDRQQVVDHGRALGLKVFQVAPGDF
jgi:shikimate kinase